MASASSNEMVRRTLFRLSEQTDALFGFLLNPTKLQLSEGLEYIVVSHIQMVWSNSFSTVFLTGFTFSR
ncbi:hypothetical protein [Bacillus spongiae]|uniref:hypothetical protein n=1 Tax=Bacillus spongiae TaxID=2683610 RepID=UPI003014BF2B